MGNLLWSQYGHCLLFLGCFSILLEDTIGYRGWVFQASDVGGYQMDGRGVISDNLVRPLWFLF
jgi:hypothetical protein